MIERAKDVAWQNVADVVVLVNIATGTSVALNTTASFLWQLLGERTEDDLVSALTDRYEVDAHQARHDVAEIIGELRASRFIQ